MEEIRGGELKGIDDLILSAWKPLELVNYPGAQLILLGVALKR